MPATKQSSVIYHKSGLYTDAEPAFCIIVMSHE